ncbi:MAG: DEAD/DEAH box helicase, partial [Bacilli bacterium]
MPIPLQQARTLITNLQIPQIENLFAQAHAKHVLLELGEEPGNFPAFAPKLEDKVTVAAYALLAAGCSIIEQGDRAGGATVVERAASLLLYAHGPTVQTLRESGFHVLVASMAFYAAGHYSRAFVTIRGVEEQTVAARIVGAFIRKEIQLLIANVNQVLLPETPTFDDQVDLDEWAIATAIARAAAMALDFAFAGDSDALNEAKGQLADAAIVASNGSHPAWWWVVRLFRLMLGDLGEASPWHVLPPFFGAPPPGELGKYISICAFGRHPIMELWSSQRAALPLALDATNSGGVINLRTSAGKTRVAELAILQALNGDPTRRILYLAPFRSLA